MHSPAKKDKLLISVRRAMLLALPLLILGACEPAHSVEMLAETDARLADQGQAAAVMPGDPAPLQAGPHWYREARSAARSGNYRQSLFFLNTAAAAGFAEFSALLNEPLFRPMYSANRWLLIVDRVARNERAMPTTAEPLPLAVEPEHTTLCGLRLASRTQVAGDS